MFIFFKNKAYSPLRLCRAALIIAWGGLLAPLGALAQGHAELFARYLTGEWDNFQQCWMENTETESHRVFTEWPHRHVHSTFERDSGAGRWVWRVTHYEGNGMRPLAQYGMRLSELPDGQLQTDFFPTTTEGGGTSALPAPLQWHYADGAFHGQRVGTPGAVTIALRKDTLLWADDGLFQRPGADPYRLLKCRFFRGWIQYPMEHIQPDSVYFYSGLILHDQGGKVQLHLPDGTAGEYTAELTQLVHSRRTPIMKLAIYAEPAERIHWNSRAVAYAWADPAARRIGINIRKVVSGWTLISDE